MPYIHVEITKRWSTNTRYYSIYNQNFNVLAQNTATKHIELKEQPEQNLNAVPAKTSFAGLSTIFLLETQLRVFL